MFRLAFLTVVTLVLLLSPAFALRQDEIPKELLNRLPETFQFIPPQVLERLELIDLEDFATSYQAGELYTVGQVNVVEHSGPIEPDVAKGMLGLMPGIPFSIQRFDRVARKFHGMMVFSRLEWAFYPREEGNLDVDLFYDSNSTRFWAPGPGYDPIGGVILGATYRDVRFKDEDKAIALDIKLNQDDPGSPSASLNWTDNTRNEGRESLGFGASLMNDWRERLKDSPGQSDIRTRTGRLDFNYTWKNAAPIGGYAGNLGLGGGVYSQDYHRYSGDPSGSPRASVKQDGTAGFFRFSWNAEQKDHLLYPSDGYSYRAYTESHFGDFDFKRTNLDFRRYIPAANILGYESQESGLGCLNDVRSLMPAASLAIQLQANVTDSEVPFSFESGLSDPARMRGFGKDRFVGSKLVAVRAEYRFAADRSRNSEIFVFTDHAWLGEKISELSSFSSVGAGLIYEIEEFGSLRLGGYFGTSLNGDGESAGVSWGYQF